MRRRSLLLALPVLVAPALAHASGGGGEKKKGGGASYLQIPTLTANVVRANGRRGVMTVEAGIDAPDTGLRQRVASSTPRLRAAYNATLEMFAASMRPDTAPDLDFLSRRLQGDTDRVLGRPGARLLLGTCLIN